jgi:RNA polymerase sigma-32 factor
MGDSGRWVDRAIRSQLDRSNLTVERERHLLRLAQRGASPGLRHAALTELWESHSKLVVAIASRYRRFNIELLDLVGAGHLGLHTAIERFDPDRYQTRLSTYAIGWIRWFIQDYIRRNTGPVRLPESSAHRQLAQNSIRLLADARRTCERERVEPTESALCERISRRIGLDPGDVACSLRMLQGGSLSLHQPGPGGADAPSLQDTLPDETAGTEDSTILRLDHAKLRNRIQVLAGEILGERERIVFASRCLADSDDVVHLDDLAVRFGVSIERVYQLEASAKRKIATALAQEGYTRLVGEGGEIRLPTTRAK